MLVDLESLVIQPTWREVLYDLVANEGLDPWNIDISDIASKYLERLRAMQVDDLRVPANVILAASILLRFKSESLKLEEEEVVIEEETYISEERPPVEIPVLSLKTRIPPKRKITLPELVAALEKVMDDLDAPETQMPDFAPLPVEIEIPKYNIEERMKEILSMVKENVDAKGFVRFTSLLKERTPLEIISVFIPLLHLAQEKKVFIFQDELFGEIFVKMGGLSGRKG